jgi:hypothetical protein
MQPLIQAAVEAEEEVVQVVALAAAEELADI